MEMTVPRVRRPIAEDLLDETGAPTALTSALRLVRAFEREGRAVPGARLVGRCNEACAAAFGDFAAPLAERLGARFAIEPQAGWAAGRCEVVAR
jgi:hypothetical protein